MLVVASMLHEREYAILQETTDLQCPRLEQLYLINQFIVFLLFVYENVIVVIPKGTYVKKIGRGQSTSSERRES